MAEDDQPTVYDPLVSPSSAVRAVPPPGTRIGKYVVERLLGTGGMGVVVSARHEQLGEVVAIKLMHAKAAKNEVSAERFAREAKQTVRIKSERVVRVLDAGTQDDTGAPYIVMEYLEGRDLGRVLHEDGPLHPQVVVDMMLQICDALAAAHVLGIVHRDIKPSNFFLTTSADGAPLVKVLDFGISKALAGDMSAAKLTETQAVFGSPTYMSPEQIRSSTNVDQRSDVWSLGVAMFELMTGKLPFMADNVAGLLASIVADAPFRISSFVDGVPPALEDIVLACLEKDPTRRVQSVAELASALRPFATSGAEAAVITGRIERLVRNSQAPGAMASARSSHSSRSFPPAARSSNPAPALDFSKTTGTDLSATGETMKKLRGGGPSTVIAIAVAIGAPAVIAVAVVSFLVIRSARTAVDPPPMAASSPPPTAASVPIPTPAASPVAPTAAVDPATTTAAPKPGTKVRPPRPGAAKSNAPATAAPPVTTAPPTPNPDTSNSRY